MKKYYFHLDTRPESPRYMKPTTVHRIIKSKDGLWTERWNEEEWEDNPELLSVFGLGGDTDYYETTEQKAKLFIKEHTKQ